MSLTNPLKKPPEGGFFNCAKQLLSSRSGWCSSRSVSSGHSSRSRCVSSRSGSWCSHGSWCRSRSRLFFFTASSQGSSSDHSCQNERFVHDELPKGLKKRFPEIVSAENCIDQANRLEPTSLSFGLYDEFNLHQILSVHRQAHVCYKPSVEAGKPGALLRSHS